MMPFGEKEFEDEDGCCDMLFDVIKQPVLDII